MSATMTACGRLDAERYWLKLDAAARFRQIVRGAHGTMAGDYVSEFTSRRWDALPECVRYFFGRGVQWTHDDGAIECACAPLPLATAPRAASPGRNHSTAVRETAARLECEIGLARQADDALGSIDADALGGSESGRCFEVAQVAVSNLMDALKAEVKALRTRPSPAAPGANHAASVRKWHQDASAARDRMRDGDERGGRSEQVAAWEHESAVKRGEMPHGGSEHALCHHCAMDRAYSGREVRCVGCGRLMDRACVAPVTCGGCRSATRQDVDDERKDALRTPVRPSSPAQNHAAAVRKPPAEWKLELSDHGLVMLSEKNSDGVRYGLFSITGEFDAKAPLSSLYWTDGADGSNDVCEFARLLVERFNAGSAAL